MHVLEIWFIKSKVPYLILKPIMLCIQAGNTKIPLTDSKNITIGKKDFLEMIDLVKQDKLKIVLEEPNSAHNGKITYYVYDTKEKADELFNVVGFKDKTAMAVLQKTKIMDYKRYEL